VHASFGGSMAPRDVMKRRDVEMVCFDTEAVSRVLNEFENPNPPAVTTQTREST
jgi:hypothetical protein